MTGDLSFETMLSEDLRQRVARHIQDLGLSPEAAMERAQAELLANNPFIPPKHGCPVNDLPPELLAHVFKLGCEMYEEERYEDEDDDHSDDDLDLEDDWETDDEEGEADEELDTGADTDVHMRSPKKGSTSLPPLRPLDADPSAVPESEDGSESELEEEPDLAFQVLVSHVCRHWRQIALGSHTLWTTLRFGFEGHLNVEKAQAWLERANGLPLDIYIDCTRAHDPTQDDEKLDDPQPPAVQPLDLGIGIIVSFDHATGTITTEPSVPVQEEEELEPCISLEDLITIMDLLIPHVQEWRIFEVTVNIYKYVYEVLSRLAQCPSAPLLEEFGLYNYEESEETETFEPAELATAFLPFHGIAPKLTITAFWGVHVAWDESLSFLKGLRDIELAYHVRDVRPSFETFRAIIDNSPELEVLTLCFSGPTGDLEVIQMPSLRTLVLCYLELEYLQPLVRSFVLPALEDLTLELQDEDYTEFVKQLVGPAQGQTRSLLAGLTTLKLAGLPCDDNSSDLFMAQLENLKKLDVNSAGEEIRFFEMLQKLQPSGKGVLYCPKLNSLRVAGIEGKELRRLVSIRKTAGMPLSTVSVGNRDFVSPKDEKWLRANLDTFDFFEPSDSEEEMVEVDDDEMDMDD
ncbi:hypothetical protein GGX14DRAFT_447706 [Mycena pura]|uniref:F-box domain-containing protein n=1 Tax=Mycena pura TaxID=153505 RepID=A0AAD6VGK3_9AGAR|nr:hypothetical protein GGX14DRAFT_447706 [Mycena pura]